MSTQSTPPKRTPPKAPPKQTADTPPGQKPMGVIGITLVGLYLVLISVLILYGLLKIWPHPTPSGEARSDPQAASTPAPGASPSPAAAATSSPATNGRTALPDPETIYFVGGRFKASIYAETRLLLIVILAGGLGALMHALRSLYWYTGNREMVWSWVALYLLLPFAGAILAVIFYFVVRGGFFSPQASFEFTSPFGFAALSSLVGLFSTQATLKLKEVAETIFTKPGAGADAKTQEVITTSEASQPEPTVTSITPSDGPIAGNANVSIQGTGFADNLTVLIGNLPAIVISSTDTTIKATTPAASGPGVVDVEVSNPNGKKATLAGGYTYVADTNVNNNDNGGRNGST